MSISKSSSLSFQSSLITELTVLILYARWNLNQNDSSWSVLMFTQQIEAKFRQFCRSFWQILCTQTQITFECIEECVSTNANSVADSFGIRQQIDSQTKRFSFIVESIGKNVYCVPAYASRQYSTETSPLIVVNEKFRSQTSGIGWESVLLVYTHSCSFYFFGFCACDEALRARPLFLFTSTISNERIYIETPHCTESKGDVNWEF